MKEKFILKHRGDFDYFLLSRTKNYEAVIASLNPDEWEQKLSKENCDDLIKGFKEIEVDIEMVWKPKSNFCSDCGNGGKYLKTPCDHIHECFNWIFKIDKNGCLILKQKS